LLGGDGGDELFGGNERLLQAVPVLGFIATLPPTLRNGLIEPLVRLLPPELASREKRNATFKHASMPMPARYDHYNLLERIGPTTVFTREFLEAWTNNCLRRKWLGCTRVHTRNR